MGLYFSLEILVLLLYLSLFLFPFGKDDLLSLCQTFEKPHSILKMSTGLGVVSFSQRIDFSLKNLKQNLSRSPDVKQQKRNLF